MKTIPATHQRLPHARRFSLRHAIHLAANRHLSNARMRGVALIIVLAIIVLVATLIIGFLSLATSERRASTTVAQNAETRLLAENAVDLVMGQIRAATTNLGNTKTWASQPGMIRVYGNTAGTNGLSTMMDAYKLYSSGTMMVTGSLNVADEVPPATWAQSPALYTDLNAPVADSSGTMEYPIIDGNGLAASGSTTYSGTNNSNSLSGQAIQGFYVNNAPGATTTNPVPMPVQWLYQLKDGTLIAPDDTSSGTATFQNASERPTTTNPIVGRIAFWTDDETCKVNINTADEGTFWDTPIANNAMERGVSSNNPPSLTGTVTTTFGFGSSYPVLNEFNRYPGHPATTSLSAVLGNWLPINATDQWTNPQNYSKELQPYWALTPRIYNGGTASSLAPQGGTQGGIFSSCSTTSTITQAINDSDRLYSTVDELYYQPALSGNSRVPSNTALTPDIIEKTKFFLTASSRAPEVTLFNTPRMSLWPVMSEQTSPGHQTPQDQLLAFCGSVGSTGTTPNPYYFQRASSSTTGNYGSAYSPTADFSSTTTSGSRNVALYQYMQKLTQNSIPGFGGNFAAKYGQTDQNQILTEAFDFIRSNVNLIPPVYPTGTQPAGYSNYVYSLQDVGYTTPDGPFTDETASHQEPYAGSYCVIPLQPTTGVGAGTKGFGRMYTITKADLIIIDADDYQKATSGSTSTVQSDGFTAPAKQVQAMLVFEFFSPTTQNIPQMGGMRIRVQGLSQLAIDGQSLFPANTDSSMVLAADAYYGGGGGDALSLMPVEAALVPPVIWGGVRTPGTTQVGQASEYQNYPFCTPTSTFIPLTQGQSTMTFTGGTITITIYNPTIAQETSATAVQTITMTFPSSQNGWPIPRMPSPSEIPSYMGSTSQIGSVPSPVGGTGNQGGPPNIYSDPTASTGVRPSAPANRLFKVWSNIVNSSNSPEYAGQFLFPSNTTALGSSVLPQSDFSGGYQKIGYAYEDDRLLIAGPGDVVREIAPNVAGPFGGDYRLYCATPTISGTQYYTMSPNYQSSTVYYAGTLHSDKFMCMGEYGYLMPTDPKPSNAQQQILIPTDTFRPTSASTAGKLVQNTTYTPWAVPNVPAALNGAFMSAGKPGDWETGIGLLPDGPLLRVPDTHVSNGTTTKYALYGYGTSSSAIVGATRGDGGYFQLGYGFPGATTSINLTPNRQICSAVQFGALPTGAVAGTEPITPWQTLLFTAQPAGRTSPATSVPSGNEHYGFQSPPDYLFLDLFWMPVVQPYAISEPLSTAGKVNMNYQIMPFNYIHRETAIDAVMKNVLMTAIPPAAVQPRAAVASYKEWDATPYCFRYQINLNDQTGTLAGFEQRFTAGDIFHSASEICSISLVPQTITQLPSGMRYYNTSVTPSYSQMTSWWAGMTATGDNLRESPYNQIYPRLTTQSNSYRVHIRVQALRQTPGDANQGVWNEAKDQVVGEYRGSYLIERYVDPNDPNLPDFAANIAQSGLSTSPDSPSTSLDDYYRFRVLERKQFAP